MHTPRHTRKNSDLAIQEEPLALLGLQTMIAAMPPSLRDLLYLASAALSADPLTSREREIIQRIAEGQTTKEIAADLGLGVKTVESHRINLMRKLDIHETATLVRYAIRRGLTAA